MQYFAILGELGGKTLSLYTLCLGEGARGTLFEKVLGWVMDTLFSEHMKLSLWAFTTEQENNAKIYCVQRNYHCWTQFGSPMARIANPYSLSIFWYSKAYIETNCSVARKPINLVTIIILIITIKIVMIVVINMIIILLTVHCCIWTGGRCNHCGSARPPRHSRPGSRGRRRIARPDHVDHGDDDDHDDDGRHGKFKPTDFQAKNFTLSISSNFNSFSKKKTQKMSENGEIYTAGKILHCRRHWRDGQIPPLHLI